MKTKIVIEIIARNPNRFHTGEENEMGGYSYLTNKEVLKSACEGVLTLIEDALQRALEPEAIRDFADGGSLDDLWMISEDADDLEDYCDLKISIKSPNVEPLILLDVKRKKPDKETKENTPEPDIIPIVEPVSPQHNPSTEPQEMKP
jgi:hypothetical protein